MRLTQRQQRKTLKHLLRPLKAWKNRLNQIQIDVIIEMVQTTQADDEATGSQDVVEKEAADVSSGASAQANVRVPSEEF